MPLHPLKPPAPPTTPATIPLVVEPIALDDVGEELCSQTEGLHIRSNSKAKKKAKGVTGRHMYAATAVSDEGQLQGAVPKGCALSSQTACVYKELRSFLPSSSLLSLVSSISAIYRAPFTFVE
jgi:hypothetical protein